MSKYYHATDYKNLDSIMNEGLRLSCDGVVYLCKKPEDCLKFAVVHCVRQILVIEVEIDDKDVVETFDHSEAFFKCRCYGSTKAIPVKNFTNMKVYGEKS